MPSVTDKQAIHQEVDEIPQTLLAELHEFIRLLKQKAGRERFEAAAMSETSLKTDWLRPEEDEAWAHL